MSIGGLLGFRLVTEVQLSPDGRWIAFVVKESDAARDEDRSNLWLVGSDERPGHRDGGSSRKILRV